MHDSYEGTLDKKTFVKLCTEFNDMVLDQMIKEKKVFVIPHFLGIIKVLEKERKVKKGKTNGKLYTTPNFPESFKKKDEIIARGGTPLVNYKDKDNRIISDNGGEAWLVYNTSPTSVTFMWSKLKRKIDNKLHKANTKYYTLKINDKAIKALGKHKRETNISYMS